MSTGKPNLKNSIHAEINSGIEYTGNKKAEPMTLYVHEALPFDVLYAFIERQFCLG